MEWLRELPKDQVISLLEKTPWRKDDHAVCDALVQTLLETHHLALEKADELPPLCALRVAQSLGSRGDKRCQPVFERLLEQHRDNEALAVPAVLAFAEYYRYIGDHAKSAETFLRAKDYTQAGNIRGNCTLHAARVYRDAGDSPRAIELYQQVAKHGYGWASGLAAYEQAKLLVAAGQYEDARRLLTAPVTGEYADQVEIVLEQGLAQLHYAKGEHAEARQHAQRALTLYDSLGEHRLKGEQLEDIADKCAEYLEWISTWERSPVVSEEDALCIRIEPGQLASSVLFVRTFSKRPLRLECDPPELKATETDVATDNAYYKRRRITVTAPAAFPAHVVHGALTIALAERPDKPGQVPIWLYRRPSLQVTPERVFFGFSDGHTPLTKTVVLTGEKPFRVLTVSAKGSWLGTQAKQFGGNHRVWQIEVNTAPRGNPAQAPPGAVVEDRILVETDIADMPVVEIPCYLHHIKR